jgi:glycosyltransferase involved in cell wall biosynthesis
MSEHKISVIIPVYNQASSLKVTLHAFMRQTGINKGFDIIVVNDGSTDELQEVLEDFSRIEEYPSLHVIHQANAGRSAARNAGIAAAADGVLIFCDADRFPAPDFVSKHALAHQAADVVIGSPMDYFGSKKLLAVDDGFPDFTAVRRLSKASSYHTAVTRLYSDKGYTESELAWVSLLIGNASMKKDVIVAAGGFDESFTEWGLEHFDLGLRLQQGNRVFKMCPTIENFHIPHSRAEGFYAERLKQSLDFMACKYPGEQVRLLAEFLEGSLSLQQFEKRFSKGSNHNQITGPEVFFKSLHLQSGRC